VCLRKSCLSFITEIDFTDLKTKLKLIVYKVVFFIHDYMPFLSHVSISGQAVVWKQPRRNYKKVFETIEEISRADYVEFVLHKELLNPLPFPRIEEVIGECLQKK
jgi:hypothetical protein